MLFLYLDCISRISWCGIFFSKQTLKIYVLSKYGGETQQLAGREQAMLCARLRRPEARNIPTQQTIIGLENLTLLNLSSL